MGVILLLQLAQDAQRGDIRLEARGPLTGLDRPAAQEGIAGRVQQGLLALVLPVHLLCPQILQVRAAS